MTKQRKAELLLVMVTVFWGISYLLMDYCLTDLQPMNLNAFRFLLAFFLLSALFFKRVRKVSRATLRYSVPIGLCLVLTYIGATYGVKYTSVSNAGFICAMTVVVTPVLEWLFLRKRPGRKLFLALLLCTAGLALLTLSDSLRPAPGDVLCLLCPLFYAGDLLLTDRAAQREDVDLLALGVTELGVTGAVMLLLSMLLEEPHLPQSPGVWAGAVFLGIFCTGVAFAVQSVWQKYTTPSRVGLIFTLEPVFSAVAAYFWAQERLALRGYAGAALMLISLLLMESGDKERKTS